MAAITNKELLALCKDDPTYKSWTSELTDDIFTTAGFEELVNNNYQLLSNFFQLSVRVILQKIKTPQPRIPGIYKAIVEEYANNEGGIFQRINTKLIRPTSPKYKNLVNGGSVDPFLIRKPAVEERFYKQNFDFQNHLTVQDYELQNMFLSESGISDFMAGVMKSLDDSYAIQKYETMRELLSKALNSTQNPLKASQKIEINEIKDDSTNAQMSTVLRAFQNMYSLMNTTVYSGAFNAKSYEHGLYPDQYVLLARAEKMNILRTTLMATTYHTDNLAIPFEIQEVNDFGGITYVTPGTTSDTPLLPVYDDFGAVKGFNASGDPDDPLVDEDDIKKVDPNENVDFVLAQKGVLFTTQQKPYQVRTIYNPAGKYVNFWADQPNSAFNYDACYDLIKFYHSTT